MNISILVISRTYQLLNKMLKSIELASTEKADELEIICSWNGTDEDIQKIKNNSLYHLNIIKLKPYNFASNMNNLKNQAQGKFIIMINDDIILDKKSIDQAIIYLNANNQAGIIGGRLRDKKGLLTHAGIHFNILNSPYHTLELLVNSSHIFIKRKTKIVPAVTGALMLSKKTILDQINFNELYKVCGEDVELCLDMRQYLKKQIHFFYDFSAIHESASTRKEFPEQQQNNNDKLNKISINC